MELQFLIKVVVLVTKEVDGKVLAAVAAVAAVQINLVIISPEDMVMVDRRGRHLFLLMWLLLV